MAWIEFEDYKRGGALFTLTAEQVDGLDNLSENPLRPWVDGVGLDEPDDEPMLLMSKRAVLRFLKGKKAMTDIRNDNAAAPVADASYLRLFTAVTCQYCRERLADAPKNEFGFPLPGYTYRIGNFSRISVGHQLCHSPDGPITLCSAREWAAAGAKLETIWLYNENCTRAGEVCQDDALIECESDDIHSVEGTQDELIEWARETTESESAYRRKCGRSVLAWFGESVDD